MWLNFLGVYSAEDWVAVVLHQGPGDFLSKPIIALQSPTGAEVTSLCPTVLPVWKHGRCLPCLETSLCLCWLKYSHIMSYPTLYSWSVRGEADNTIRWWLCVELDVYISISPEGDVVKMLFCFECSTGSSFWLHLTSLLKLAGSQEWSDVTSYIWHSSVARSFAAAKPFDNKSNAGISTQFCHNRGWLLVMLLISSVWRKKEKVISWHFGTSWVPCSACRRAPSLSPKDEPI